jgi:hypothetical protein
LTVTLGPFVDRAVERRELWESLSPFRPDVDRVRGLLIRGDDDIGKSWLVRRAMGELIHLGFQVRYCELASGSEHVNFRDVLSRLRSGWPKGPTSPVYRPLPEGWFAEFDVVNSALETRISESGLKNLRASEIDDFFKAFTNGLKERGKPVARASLTNESNEGSATGEQADQESEVVLVLDQFTREATGYPPEDFLSYLRPKLLEPILSGSMPKVSFVLVMRERELPVYGITDLAGNIQIDKMKGLPVAFLKEEEAQRLFREFCRYEWSTNLEHLYAAWFNTTVSGKGVWRPAQFSPFAFSIRAVLGTIRV